MRDLLRLAVFENAEIFRLQAGDVTALRIRHHGIHLNQIDSDANGRAGIRRLRQNGRGDTNEKHDSASQSQAGFHRLKARIRIRSAREQRCSQTAAVNRIGSVFMITIVCSK